MKSNAGSEPCSFNQHIVYQPTLYDRLINFFDTYNTMIEKKGYKPSVELQEIIKTFSDEAPNNTDFLIDFPVIKKHLESL